MDRIKFFESQVKNLHDSQKWMWSILAGFSVIGATRELLQHIEKVGVPDVSSIENASLQISPYLYFLTVVLIVYRFYVGDSRILDYYYDSVPKSLIDKDNPTLFLRYLKTLDKKQLFGNTAGRVIQYLLIALLALSITDHNIFGYLSAILLAFNAAYCWAIIKWFSFKSEGLELVDENIRENLDFIASRKSWLRNNSAFSFLIFLVLGFDCPGKEIVVAVLLLFNSVIDVIVCRDVYLPDFALISKPDLERYYLN